MDKEITEALSLFCEVLLPDVASKIDITEPYRYFEVAGEPAHWPTSYDQVWRDGNGDPRQINAGVYLHFNEFDELLYVGKAVSVGSRLGSYFKYADDGKACLAVDPKLKNSKMVRCIPLDAEYAFLGPSLELFLINKLNPPANTQGRTGYIKSEE